MKDKPANLPKAQPDGAPLKPLPTALLERRATAHFSSEPVPEDYLQAILECATQAPSGYNFQPWRFIVVRDAGNRKRLQRAAFDQEKVSEAPVVVIFVGMKEETKHRASDILMEGARRGLGSAEKVEGIKEGALGFLSTMRMDLWVNRHVMIAFTTMMLAAEAYGFDTAPMEGFEPDKVKAEFGIPEEGEVVALLAIGRQQGKEREFPGRFGLEEIVHVERYGRKWQA